MGKYLKFKLYANFGTITEQEGTRTLTIQRRAQDRQQEIGESVLRCMRTEAIRTGLSVEAERRVASGAQQTRTHVHALRTLSGCPVSLAASAAASIAYGGQYATTLETSHFQHPRWDSNPQPAA